MSQAIGFDRSSNKKTPNGVYNKQNVLIFRDPNHQIVIEIGGKIKETKQIRSLEKAYIFQVNIEIGFQNKTPLWLLGFLY